MVTAFGVAAGGTHAFATAHFPDNVLQKFPGIFATLTLEEHHAMLAMVRTWRTTKTTIYLTLFTGMSPVNPAIDLDVAGHSEHYTLPHPRNCNGLPLVKGDVALLHARLVRAVSGPFVRARLGSTLADCVMEYLL